MTTISKTSRAGDRAGTAGFTLLELLLVLTLIAAVMAVVVTGLPSGATETQAAASAKQVAAGLKLARGEAIRLNREVAFVLDLERRRYQVAEHAAVQLPDAVSLALYTGASELIDTQVGSVRFFPDGSATGGRVHIRHHGQKKDDKIVSIDWVTGRVSVSD